MDAQRQAVAPRRELARHLRQVGGVVAVDVQDGAEHLLLQEVRGGDLRDHRAEIGSLVRQIAYVAPRDDLRLALQPRYVLD